MLDLVYVLLIAATFALVGLIAKGVEKLGPRAGGSPQREALRGGERG